MLKVIHLAHDTSLPDAETWVAVRGQGPDRFEISAGDRRAPKSVDHLGQTGTFRAALYVAREQAKALGVHTIYAIGCGID